MSTNALRAMALILVLIGLLLVLLAILVTSASRSGDIGKEQGRQPAITLVNVPVIERRAAQLDTGREGQDGGGFHGFSFALRSLSTPLNKVAGR